MVKVSILEVTASATSPAALECVLGHPKEIKPTTDMRTGQKQERFNYE